MWWPLLLLPTLLFADPIINYENDGPAPFYKRDFHTEENYYEIIRFYNRFIRRYDPAISSPKNISDIVNAFDEDPQNRLWFATIFEANFSSAGRGIIALNDDKSINLSSSYNDFFDRILKSDNRVERFKLLGLIYKVLMDNGLEENSAFKKFIFHFISKELPSFSLICDFYSLFNDVPGYPYDKFSFTPRLALAFYQELFNVTGNSDSPYIKKFFHDFALNPSEQSWDNFLNQFIAKIRENSLLNKDIDKIKIRSFPDINDDFANILALDAWDIKLIENEHVLNKLINSIDIYPSQYINDGHFLRRESFELVGKFIRKNINSSSPLIKKFLQEFQESLVAKVSTNFTDYKYAGSSRGGTGIKSVLWVAGVLRSIFPGLTLTNLKNYPFAHKVMKDVFASRLVAFDFYKLDYYVKEIVKSAEIDFDKNFFNDSMKFFDNKELYESMALKGLDYRVMAFFDPGGVLGVIFDELKESELQKLWSHVNSAEYSRLPETHKQTIYYSLPMKMAYLLFDLKESGKLTGEALKLSVDLLEWSIEQVSKLNPHEKLHMLYWQRNCLATFIEYGSSKFGHSILGVHYDRYWKSYGKVQSDVFAVLLRAEENGLKLYDIRALADAFFRGDASRPLDEFGDTGFYQVALERLNFVISFLPSDDRTHQLYADVYKSFLNDLLVYMKEFSSSLKESNSSDQAKVLKNSFLGEYIWRSLAFINSSKGQIALGQSAHLIGYGKAGQVLQLDTSIKENFLSKMVLAMTDEYFLKYNLFPILLISFPDKIDELLDDENFQELLEKNLNAIKLDYAHLDSMLAQLITTAASIEEKPYEIVRNEILGRIKQIILPKLFSHPVYGIKGELEPIANKLIDYLAKYCETRLTD
jgi:hypothetical protein